MKCNVCFRKCDIPEGHTGYCGIRSCRDGRIVPDNYGRVTALALDPIEKKPLARFRPGSRLLSVGSYGCNLRCPFCQNDDISWSDRSYRLGPEAGYISPQELADTAIYYRSRGNIGVAYTYNEPLIGYEYILDTAKLVHEAGMVSAIVTNGCVSVEILEKLAPYTDAMNIDLKGYTHRYYTEVLHGDLDMVRDLIRYAVQICHVELTTLIVPGENDTEDEMRDITEFISGLTNVYDGTDGRDIPLHISRFFPRFNMQDRPPTDVRLIYQLADVARERLRYVYTGNC